MPQIQSIKHLAQKGESISAIARALCLDRKTVRKYIQKEDFSPEAPVKQKRKTKYDAYDDIIRGYLEADKKVWRKQRHTAVRVFERLKAEEGYEGSYETVQRKVKEIRGRMRLDEERSRAKAEAYLPLEWEPGTAQVDFGDVQVEMRGELRNCHFLVVSYPYSNVAYAQLFFGETAECVCHGLQDIFRHAGGTPRRIVFDNATGIGKRVMSEVHRSELFERFELHYGFQSTFCNPYSGHEKGNVERAVFTNRSHLFVPVPIVEDIVQYNEKLLTRSFKLCDKDHYRKETSQMELFQEDMKNFLELPHSEFNACRYVRRKTNKYGHIQLEGHHFYSTLPELKQMMVMVEIGAHTIRIFDEHTGKVVAEHERRFGEARTESIDHSTTLRALTARPGAWEQSGVRGVVTQVLQDYIDVTKGSERRSALTLLSDLNDEFGFETAIRAMTTAVENGRVDHDGTMVLAARLASGEPADIAVPGVSLDVYDKLFLCRGGDAV